MVGVSGSTFDHGCMDVLGRWQVGTGFIDPAETVFQEDKRDDLDCEDACVRDEGREESLGVGVLGFLRSDLRHGGVGCALDGHRWVYGVVENTSPEV